MRLQISPESNHKQINPFGNLQPLTINQVMDLRQEVQPNQYISKVSEEPQEEAPFVPLVRQIQVPVQRVVEEPGLIQQPQQVRLQNQEEVQERPRVIEAQDVP